MELTRLSIRNRAVKQIIGYCSLRAQKKDCNEYHQLEDIATGELTIRASPLPEEALDGFLLSFNFT